MQGVTHNAKPVKWLQISLHKQANKKLKKSFSNADKLVGALRACLFGLGFSLAFFRTQLRWKAVVSFSAAHKARGGQRWLQLPGHLGLARTYTASVLLHMSRSPAPWKCLLCHAGVGEIKRKIETICAVTHPSQRCHRVSARRAASVTFPCLLTHDYHITEHERDFEELRRDLNCSGKVLSSLWTVAL